MLKSVIIPALNEAENLTRNLPQVRAQLAPADELLVIDNGSSDESAAAAAKCGAEVIHELVRGRSQARNAGIRRARSEILVFLDADCTPQAGWLAELLKPFENPSIGCVAGAIQTIGTGTPFSNYLVNKGHLAQSVYFEHPFHPYAATGNAAFRRAVLERIGFFDEALWAGHDADLSWRMQLETTYKIAAAPLAIVSHKQDLSFNGFLKQKRRHAQGAVLLYKKYQHYRQAEVASFKEIYWEYRSIGKRGFDCLAQLLAARLGLKSSLDLDQQYQLVIELGEKLGRIEGSIRNHVWYP